MFSDLADTFTKGWQKPTEVGSLVSDDVGLLLWLYDTMQLTRRGSHHFAVSATCHDTSHNKNSFSQCMEALKKSFTGRDYCCGDQDTRHFLPMDTLLSAVLLLKPEPETVSLVPPIKEPNIGEMLCTSRMYSTVAFMPLLYNGKETVVSPSQSSTPSSTS